MHHELTTRGIRLLGAQGRVELGPARPAATVRAGGRERRWLPQVGRVESEHAWRADGGPAGIELEVELHASDGGVALTTRLRNTGPDTVEVERLGLLRSDSLRVGEDPRRWRAYRNGYQSWAGTRTIGVDEADADLPTRLVRISGTDAKHRSPSTAGHVRSDSLGVVCEPVSGDALGVTVTSLADAFGFVELVAPRGHLDRFEVWCDLDGIPVAPGEAVEASAWLTAAHGQDAGGAALAAATEVAGRVMRARGTDAEPPAGWCSWYYYFAKVTEADVLENLEVLASDGRDGPTFGCQYVMVDDGHQSRIGDWLTTDGDKFPSGMPAVAERIRDAGFDAGIWWAPFLVHPESRVAAEHPEWLVRNERGRPIVGILNPVWSATSPMRVLDTTHPEVLDHLRHVARVIGDDWGYAIQKLDFLYAAALPGVRHDRTVTRARSLRMGLEAIREGAGEHGFLLGCGCPLGPAIGVVDAMRIGADVTPYWSSAVDRIGGRGRHGLATRNAVVNVTTRAVVDRRWWRNDPDCLMVRDTDTRLTEEEVRVLATVMGMTDGMLVLSDRLSRVGAARHEVIRTARDLAGGRVVVPDLFERALPELLVAEHEGHVDVGVLNLGERTRQVAVDLGRRGIRCDDGTYRELWTGRPVEVRGGLADFGPVPPHAARVLRIGRDHPGAPTTA